MKTFLTNLSHWLENSPKRIEKLSTFVNILGSKMKKGTRARSKTKGGHVIEQSVVSSPRNVNDVEQQLQLDTLSVLSLLLDHDVLDQDGFSSLKPIVGDKNPLLLNRIIVRLNLTLELHLLSLPTYIFWNFV